ncbi:MAG: tRNA (adenosine(37)-N6)-dimethylallyltransferase MiaA [Candidatus Eremiobacteraeota bacterium]|nr:tRNA (adenosine(37)-N6)-dimethylallyltransferase MiaA [Candidatus Eremiobacteraeota bacterium]MBV8667732.1 tRNA (adenosine(37)-N6)-dimethylallyltransferase MiaA [Candidatus Eremiobacteraeota bacterium]
MPAWTADHAAPRRGGTVSSIQTSVGHVAPRALIICGPTSSGKSTIALAVAQALGGEVVNADSRQIYRGTRIGSGMPSEADLAVVPHHLYGFVDPAERYSAARYVDDACAVIDAVARRRHLPIIAGGTGFYIEALTGSMPLDRPPGDERLRSRLRKEARAHTVQTLWEWLAVLAPARAAAIPSGDSYRVMRALEVVLASRQLADPHMQRTPVRSSLPCEIVVLRVRRELLSQRVVTRVRSMFDRGLIDEAQTLRSLAADAPALSGIGYAEALAVIDGLATRAEALDQTMHRTRAYAKRQETWFRRMRDAFVVDADDTESAIAAVAARARERLAVA